MENPRASARRSRTINSRMARRCSRSRGSVRLPPPRRVSTAACARLHSEAARRDRMHDPPWPYDLIAQVYATDMGRSMPFDDVGFYRGLCRGARGRVLELGCGTGRILLDLIASGVDAIGVDRSLPMLKQMRE